VSPTDFTADARLDYARALAMQGKNTEACAQYEALLAVYAGEEARCRYALLLQQMGQEERAQELFVKLSNLRKMHRAITGAASANGSIPQNRICADDFVGSPIRVCYARRIGHLATADAAAKPQVDADLLRNSRRHALYGAGRETKTRARNKAAEDIGENPHVSLLQTITTRSGRVSAG